MDIFNVIMYTMAYNTQTRMTSQMTSQKRYVPPQKRMTANRMVAPKRLGVNEFPQLTPAKQAQVSKLDFKGLFKKVEKRRQIREKRIKRGWVKLTKDGLVDSLTHAERNEEELWDEYNKTIQNLDVLVTGWDKQQMERLERDGYLSDYEVDPPSEDESEPEESEEEYESEEDEIEQPSKWFTS